MKGRRIDRRDFLKGAVWLGAGATLGGGLLAGCGQQTAPAQQDASSKPQASGSGSSGSKPVPELTLALLAPLTGVAASWGPMQADGFKRAVADLNAAGGIKSLGGAKLKLEVLDTETKSEVAASQAERIAQNPNVVMISGCNQSAASVVVSQVAHKNQIPFATGTDADPQITEQGSKYSFRIAGTTEVYPREMLKWVKGVREKKGVKANKVAFLSSSSLLGKTANQFAEQWAKQLGFEIVDLANYDPTSVKDFSGYISKYKAAGVEVFLGTHDPEPGILVVRAMKQMDWAPTIFGGMFGTIGTQDWINAVGKDGNYAYNVWSWIFDVKGLGMEQFNPAFKANYGKMPDNWDCAGYSVVAVLWDALERAGTTDRVKLRDAIAQTKLKPGERRLFQMDGVEFDEKGSNVKAGGFVAMNSDGAMRVVGPDQYAVMEPVIPHPAWSKM